MNQLIRRGTAVVAAVGTCLALGAASASASTTLHWRIFHLVRVGAPNTVISIAASGPRDVWAVDVLSKHVGGTYGYVLHWDGTQWRRLSLPAHFDPAEVRLSSPQNVWVFGWLQKRSGSTAEALRYAGPAWVVQKDLPAWASPVVLGPRDVWVARESHWVRGKGWRTVLEHWDGTWHSVTLPLLVSSQAPLAGSSAGNVWIAGTRPATRTAKTGWLIAYRWNGTAWHRFPMPRYKVLPEVSIGVRSARNVWISSGRAAVSHGKNIPVTLYWNGHRWSRLPSSDSLAQMGIPMPDAFGDVWFSARVYWNGHRWAYAPPRPGKSCPGGLLDFDWVDAVVPGRRAALAGGECLQRPATGPGMIGLAGSLG